MAYHDDVAMVVRDAEELCVLAREIETSILAFNERFEELEAAVRACKYPIREFRALASSIKAKIKIPDAPRIAPPPKPDDDPNDPAIPASHRRI